MPTPHVWVKITPFGDYTDPKQNHKDISRNTEQYHLVQLVKKSCPGRHPGSKGIHALRSNK